MTIVAEGVETFEELAYLQAATVSGTRQGFYFSEPFYLEDMSGAKKFYSESHRARQDGVAVVVEFARALGVSTVPAISRST